MKLREYFYFFAHKSYDVIQQFLLFHVSLQSIHESSKMYACGAADALNNNKLL